MNTRDEARTWWEVIATEVFSEYWEQVLFANSVAEEDPTQLLDDVDPLMLVAESGPADHKDAWIERLVLQRFETPKRELLEYAKIELVRRLAEYTHHHAWRSSVADVDLEWRSQDGERQLVVVAKSAIHGRSSQLRRRLDKVEQAAANTIKDDPYRVVLIRFDGPDVDLGDRHRHTYGGDALWWWLTGQQGVASGLVRAMHTASAAHLPAQNLVLRRAISQLQHDLDEPELVARYPWLSHFTGGPELPPPVIKTPATLPDPAA